MLTKTIKIELQRFKHSGKFYDSFEVELEANYLNEFNLYMNSVSAALRKRTDAQDFIFYTTHPDGFPILILPDFLVDIDRT